MQQPILIGGKRLISIKVADIQEIFSSWQFEGTEVVAISYKSILIKEYTINGIIYRTNETIYTLCESDNTTQHIVSCTLIRIYFLVWSLESSYRHLLVILTQENKNFVLWAAHS